MATKGRVKLITEPMCAKLGIEGGQFMPTLIVKEEAHKIMDRLPANATWDDLMHQFYVREVIERGLADSKAGRTKDVKQIRGKFGLPTMSSLTK
jgi:hypothetical protein